ncbi:MAG: D-2-hydroxyacid dehydrogenase [Minisyncoccia bacterium]
MEKILIIMAEQARPGAPDGPHTFRPEHEAMLHSCLGPDDELIVATPDEAPPLYAEATVVASFPARMPDISLLPQAKWLHSFSAGVDRILTPDVARSEVLLSNSRGVHATPIAEHIIGFCLTFTRGFRQTHENQQKHRWEKAGTLGELRDANILIVGMGEIGTEAARLFGAFGAHVHALVRKQRAGPDFVERMGTLLNLDEELPWADFIIITLPHTSETHHLFDRSKFLLMKPEAIIMNIGRGGIINESDLIDALGSGRIGGAGLDVFEREPLPSDSPLWDMEQVILTPHHSGLSHKYMDRATDLLCKNLQAYLKGQKLPTTVDKTLGY